MALIPGTLLTGTKYPSDPQALLDMFASYLTAPEAKKNRPTVTEIVPTAGGTVTFNSGGQDETLFLNHSGTIATLTITLPADSVSVIGQTVRVFARSEVTAVTITAGPTVYAVAFGTPDIAAGAAIAYQKVKADTWARIV